MSAKPEGRHWFVWLVIGFEVVVIIGFFIGLYLLYQDFSFSRRAQTTQAKIIDIDYTQSAASQRYVWGNTNTYPIFAFTDQNGTEQVVKPIVAMDGDFRIGDIRSIIFDPAYPSARVQLEGWHFFTGIGGIVLLATAPMAGLFMWAPIYQYRRKKRMRLRRNRKARERRARLKAEKAAAKER